MRYLTVGVHTAETGALHPIEKRLAEAPAVQQEAIHHAELLGDGTVVMLAEGSGDRERYEEIMQESTHVDTFLVSGEDRWMATSQFEADGPVRRFLEVRRESDLVVEWPIKFIDAGSVKITFLGTESAFREFYSDTGQSEAFTVEVIETGSYDPNAASFLRTLTTRQQEVLQVAVEEGYYSNPREATHQDVADVIGIAPTTVGDHLREVETRVFETLIE
ncbi:HTH DNA binding domain-containing protein [Halobiforma haloterrestris]|uniref:HTH DNA binding domain-containing protein n=1 Tax=Natronobacterium haloterrestre TaxID=148448 RepID=A0A1I1JU64_NATHA|nr:helix-turn-helix domain-containing protein [Halobiforma haloterrestris]SFC52056.1 HTH DNA binding domain-containing protein [Halobiforma haloterrestris]